MPQENPNVQNLKKKRRKELRAYFKEISQKEGFFAAVKRTMKYMKRRHGKKRGRFWPSKSTLARQTQQDTTGWPKISVCIPAFNPPRQFFDELLASLTAQTYPNWEACIANASDDAAVVGELVEKHSDERIIVKKIQNGGISENTNTAVGMASGHYVVLLDHDDLLSPDALFEVARMVARTEASFIYSDEALFERDPKNPTAAHFKPDWSPQYFLNVNYITHLVAIRKDIIGKIGGFRKEFDGAQDYDLFLRVVEETGPPVHIRKVLYYWRQHAASTSTGVEAKPYVTEAGIKALEEHLARENIRGEVREGKFPSTYKIDYAIKERPLISIIIPNCEHIPDLDRCIRSIYGKSQYMRFEVLVVENNSKMVETFAYYQKLNTTYQDCKVLVYEETDGFNFSRICNFGRDAARGDYLLFLNNDTEVITPEWLNEMLMLCQLDAVGAVGAMLYYPDDTVQHAGVITGLGGFAGHSHKYALRGKSGYMFRQACVQELSAVTAACIMVKRTAFDEVGGFDAGFEVAYNDVDLCLRLRQKGHSIVFTPYAELYHHESKSRGSDEEGEAADRFAAEQQRLIQRFGEDALLHDPYYSPWLTLDREDFTENDVLPQT